MARLLQLVWLIAVLFVSAPVLAQDVRTVIERLRYDSDFRVRVQAALDLGKEQSSLARPALEAALKDPNGSVRAAAAAALKVLGDPAALPALKQQQSDGSAAVRNQIRASVTALEAIASKPARLIVKLGTIKNGTKVRSKSLVEVVEQASREKLGRIPHVRVVDVLEEPARGRDTAVPQVMLTARLRRLKAYREGGDIVYSARVEYIVHRMPGQSILSTLSGTASAKATPDEARNPSRSAELRRVVLDAAIDSAMRRANEAFATAMQ